MQMSDQLIGVVGSGDNGECVAEGHFNPQQYHGVVVGEDDAQCFVRLLPVRYRHIVTGCFAQRCQPCGVFHIHELSLQGHVTLTAAEGLVQDDWIRPCSSAMTMAIQRDLTPNFRRMLQKW
jgi:hypothetical protein